MAKRIVAKTGEYQNQQNETKGEYTKLGVMLNNNNGDYMLLDPSVNLAGVLIKQNALAAKTGKEQRDMVMLSIFDDNNQGQQQAPAQGGFQQQAPQQSSQWPHGNQAQQQTPQHQGGYQNQPGKQ